MLRQRGAARIRLADEKFDEAFVHAYQLFAERAANFNLVPEFRLALDPLSGQSATLRDSISKAANLRYVSLDNPEFVTVRLMMGDGDMARIAERSGIPSDLLLQVVADLEGQLGSSIDR